MNLVLISPLLAADPGTFMYLGDRFRSENAAFGPLSVGVAAILAVAAVALCWILFRSRNTETRQTIDHPWKLLRELMQAHQLGRSEERLLTRMVRRYGIDPPARLMLEPERFQSAAADAAFVGEKQAILRLKERLFESR